MARKTIYLIRHGETEWNTLGKFQGKTDTPLSDSGREQARKLAKRLKETRFDIIYSSPLMRAAETAAPLSEQRNLPVVYRGELKELDFAHWEGYTLAEIAEKYPEEYENCRTDPFKHGFRYGLEYGDVTRTAGMFIDECIYNCRYERIAIVSHAAIIKMILTVMFELPSSLIHSVRIDNCSVSVVSVETERNVILRLNDTGEMI